MLNLHENMYGKKLFEGDIPKIINSLTIIAEEIKRSNDLREKELELKKLIYEKKLK